MERTTDTDHPMPNTEVQTQLELQLHGQYATNNNAYLGSIVVLLTTLLAVFAGYGCRAFYTRQVHKYKTLVKDYLESEHDNSTHL